MTPDQFRSARHALGLSARQMALALGLAEGRTIRRYESGTIQPSGPVKLLLTRLLVDDGLSPEDFGL